MIAAINNIYPVITRRLWVVAFVFGLVHGFGFASVLTEFGLPPDRKLVALVFSTSAWNWASCDRRRFAPSIVFCAPDARLYKGCDASRLACDLDDRLDLACRARHGCR